MSLNGIDYKTGTLSLQNIQVLAFKANTKKQIMSHIKSMILIDLSKSCVDKGRNNIGKIKVKSMINDIEHTMIENYKNRY